MANIFDAVAQGLGALQQEVAQNEHQNRINAEGLAATDIYNDFESQLSKDLYDQQVNYDGSYDIELTNKEKFNQLKEDALSRIDNSNVRNHVAQYIERYKSDYEIRSKIVALGLEKDIQTRQAEQQQSILIGKVNSNPDNYQSALAELQYQSSMWSEQLRRERYDDQASGLSSAYVLAKTNQLFTQREKNQITQEQLVQERQKLREFLINGNTPMKADRRQAYISAFDQEDLTMLEAINKAAKTAGKAELDQLIEANGTGDYRPSGLDPDAAIQQKIEVVYADDPAKKEEYLAKAEVSKELRAVNSALNNGDTATAEALYSAAQIKQDQYAQSGDVYKTNAYQSLVASIRSTIDSSRKAKQDNMAQYLVDRGDTRVNYYTAVNAAQPVGERDYSERNDLIYRKSLIAGIAKSSIKFIPEQEDNQIRQDLQNIKLSGNYTRFEQYSANLLHDYTAGDIPGLNIRDTIFRQLSSPEMESDGITPKKEPVLLTVAMKYAANGNHDIARKFFEALRVTDKKNKFTQDETDKAINSSLNDLRKAFANYGDLYSSNPVEYYSKLYKEIFAASDSDGVAFAKNSANALAKDIHSLAGGADYELISNPLLNSKIPLPLAQYQNPENRKEVVKFISSRAVFKQFMLDMKSGKLPSPINLPEAVVTPLPYVERGQDFSNATFSKPLSAEAKRFSTSSKGFLENIEIEGRRTGEYKFDNLLQTGVFLPVGDGSSFRLYAYFTGDKIRRSVIIGRDPIEDTPLYFEISGKDIYSTYMPKYKMVDIKQQAEKTLLNKSIEAIGKSVTLSGVE